MTPISLEKKQSTRELVQLGLEKRYRREKRFRLLGLSAIIVSIFFLLVLLGTIFYNGCSVFRHAVIHLDVTFDEGVLAVDDLAAANYPQLVKQSLDSLFPEVKGRREKRELNKLVSSGASFILQQMVVEDPSLIGTTVRVSFPADDDVDMLLKGRISREVPEENRRLSDKQVKWIDHLVDFGRLTMDFNTIFFTAANSSEPELSGIRGALIGSVYTLFITLMLSFPIGTASALYLEEFAPKNKWTDFIEVNINNLAAVPSIIFGLLGLAVFLNGFHLPRSAPLVGGMVLTLMTLPTIIIASRASIKAVPHSIREAAYAVGASKMQAVLHHVLPLAMPGMMTGTIIGMAQALGETAPLLMIGMVAFIVNIPGGFMDPATVLPVQIFLWADAPERAFVERTSAAIMVLLLFLIFMNATAVLLRRKFERRW